METTHYLNYSTGLYLQDLCEQALNNLDSSEKLNELHGIVKKEQCVLKKNVDTLWNCTVSDICFFEYLTKIDKILNGTECIREELGVILGEIKGLTREKIHVLFLTQEPACWPSISSVFKAANEDLDVEAHLVYTPFFHTNYLEQVDHFDTYRNDMGLPIIRHYDFELEQISPDIVFMVKPYANVPEQYMIKHLEKVIPKFVYIPYGMEITTDLIKYGFQYYLHYKAWRHVAYGPVVKEYGAQYGYRNGENIVVWGHPKADYFADMKAARDSIPEEWKRIIGNRKTILWTPHHLVNLNENGTGTWLVYGEKILNLAINKPELVFIFRPHPLMMGALQNSGAMSKFGVERLQQKIRKAANIIWDETDDYHNAFNAADAIITDGTTFSIEFLYTKKPIMLTARNIDGFYLRDEMLESYYIADSVEDIELFMNQVAESKDPLYESRMKMYEKTFFIPQSGTVGENIIKNMKKDLKENCKVEPQEQNQIIEKSYRKNQELRTVSKNEFPLVSILVLCYKNSDLLIGMLESIFKQDYPRIQLIVSDDGSEDFDVDGVLAYINTRRRNNIESVLVRKNEENIGTVRHVDLALREVAGNYFIFTAADDRFKGNDVISSYVEQFLRNPDAWWLVARCQMTSPDYKKNICITPTDEDTPYFMANDPIKLFSRWSRRAMAIPCCMAFKKGAIELVGGIDLEYKYLEDWPLLLKLLRLGNAPIYHNQVSAIHSTGGISNSNTRYGVEKRKVFYDDKYLLFRKEVDPYIHLQTKEDRRAYKSYLREIMQRHYFFYVDWPCTSKLERLKLCVKKPICFWWVFENGYVKHREKIKRKKLFLASQLLLLFSLFFMKMSETAAAGVFSAMGMFDLIAGLILFVCTFATFPLDLYFKYKAMKRKKLVS